MAYLNNTFASMIKDELEKSIETKKLVIERSIPLLNEIAHVMIEGMRNGNKLLIFGNGGSAADSQHMAAEFVGKFNMVRKALPALALTTDTSILTSISNDDAFENVFARQIEALGRASDIALGISTSGNSPNVLKGLAQAAEMGLVTIGFTGQGGGKLKHVADYCFRAPSDHTARIQEVHITVAHALCGIVEEELCSAPEKILNGGQDLS